MAMKFDTIKELFDAIDGGKIGLLQYIDTVDTTKKLQSYLEQRWKNGIFSGELLSLKKLAVMNPVMRKLIARRWAKKQMRSVYSKKRRQRYRNNTFKADQSPPWRIYGGI